MQEKNVLFLYLKCVLKMYMRNYDIYFFIIKKLFSETVCTIHTGKDN